MVNINKIREKLIEAIQQSGMTQTKLSQKIGVCHQAIGQYLYQNKLPALDTLANLCAVLDLDANDILCVDEYVECNVPKFKKHVKPIIIKPQGVDESELIPAVARSKDNAVKAVYLTREEIEKIQASRIPESDDDELL